MTDSFWNLKDYLSKLVSIPDSKVHGTNMGPIWGQQDPGGPHVGPMNFAIWDHCTCHWPRVVWCQVRYIAEKVWVPYMCMTAMLMVVNVHYRSQLFYQLQKSISINVRFKNYHPNQKLTWHTQWWKGNMPFCCSKHTHFISQWAIVQLLDAELRTS